MARKASTKWSVGEEISISELLKGAAEMSYGVLSLEHLIVAGQCTKCGLGTVELLLINEKEDHLSDAVEKAICEAADKIRANKKALQRD